MLKVQETLFSLTMYGLFSTDLGYYYLDGLDTFVQKI